jgi:hypothetical protein
VDPVRLIYYTLLTLCFGFDCVLSSLYFIFLIRRCDIQDAVPSTGQNSPVLHDTCSSDSPICGPRSSASPSFLLHKSSRQHPRHAITPTAHLSPSPTTFTPASYRALPLVLQPSAAHPTAPILPALIRPREDGPQTNASPTGCVKTG